MAFQKYFWIYLRFTCFPNSAPSGLTNAEPSSLLHVHCMYLLSFLFFYSYWSGRKNFQELWCVCLCTWIYVYFIIFLFWYKYCSLLCKQHYGNQGKSGYAWKHQVTNLLLQIDVRRTIQRVENTIVVKAKTVRPKNTLYSLHSYILLWA